jgi:DNA-directed RNA polymerase specialized sigma24 family protein
MAKRKPLPYHAAEKVDQAQMELSDVARLLLSLMTGEQTTPEERYRRLGLAIDRVHRASRALGEIRKQEK